MKEKQIKESKRQIQSLAVSCINKIYENKFLKNQKERYLNQINFIKSIFNHNSKLQNTDISIKKIIIIDQIKDFYNNLITSNLQLKKEEKKILNKYNTYKDELIKENSINKKNLENIQYDNFLLLYNLKEKDDILKGLYYSFEILRQNLYFKENKREIQVNDKWGVYYLKVNLNDLSEKMMLQCQAFIQFRNKCEKKEKEKNKIKAKIELYKDIIKFYKNYLDEENLNISSYKIKKNNTKNSKNKKSPIKKKLTKSIFMPNDNKLSLCDNKDNLFDENLLLDEEIKKKDENNKDINNKKEQLYSSVLIDKKNYENLFKYNSHEINKKNSDKSIKNSSKSIKSFLTVEELFDVNNHEGKEEAIIDDELHSDDESVFEIKVKPIKKITIHYIPNIRKQIPKINLSQIEFNKQKVMNEADLYSLQRRQFISQNPDENIKTMKKKIKKLKHIIKLNKKKLIAFENYSKNIENNYKALKSLKIQSSLAAVKIPTIQKFFKDGEDKNGIINEIDNIDLGDDYSDHIEDEFSHDISNTETNPGTRIYISDKNNIYINNNYMANFIDGSVNIKKESKKKLTDYNKTNCRANSK